MDLQRIFSIAEKKGISKTALAGAAKMTREGFHRAVQNGTLTFEAASKIADHMGVSMLDFLDKSSPGATPELSNITGGDFSRLEHKVDRLHADVRAIMDKLEV